MENSIVGIDNPISCSHVLEVFVGVVASRSGRRFREVFVGVVASRSGRRFCAVESSAADVLRAASVRCFRDFWLGVTIPMRCEKHSGHSDCCNWPDGGSDRLSGSDGGLGWGRNKKDRLRTKKFLTTKTAYV